MVYESDLLKYRCPVISEHKVQIQILVALFMNFRGLQIGKMAYGASYG